MIKIINWKVKITFTNYNLHQYTLISGDFQNSTNDRKNNKMIPLQPMV